MSVDTVIYSITSVRASFIEHPEFFSKEGLEQLLASLDCMRACLMKEDIEGFDRYVDNLLAREPDRADFVLEELFEDLGITQREELTKKLMEA